MKIGLYKERKRECMILQTDGETACSYRWRECTIRQTDRQIDEKKRVQNFNDPSGKEEALGLFCHQFYA